MSANGGISGYLDGVDLRRTIRKLVGIELSILCKQFMGELLGTTIIALFACGSGAQFKFMKYYDNGLNNVLNENLTAALGPMLAILIVGQVSGAHLNPAVSFGFLLTGRLSLKRFIVYVIAQFIGAFLGATLVFFIYYEAIYNYPSENFSELVGLFGTFPRDNTVSTFCAFIELTLGTMLLMMTILAFIDKHNPKLSPGYNAILNSVVVFVIISSFGYQTGNALNPARDFSPRLFSSIIWGSEAFSKGNYFFWIPIVGPLFGSFLSVVVYTLLIHHHPPHHHHHHS